MLKERLVIVDDLLVENQAKLERVLDLYLAGDFPKEMLIEQKERLQKTVDALGVSRKINLPKSHRERLNTDKPLLQTQ